uniref:ShKT domain-containing protein n=1 Tax=Meloidogyne floridensis TaxID=298350 RepID=A0A915NF58_9BILA
MWLFCDMRHQPPRCASKIKIGGNCYGYFYGEDVCAFGECRDGKCVQTEEISTTQRPIISSIKPWKVIENCILKVFTMSGKIGMNLREEIQHESLEKCVVLVFCSEQYMKRWCKASCKQCVYDYNMDSECNDRHEKCLDWAGQGECERNQFWMQENCRDACDRCLVGRSEVCKNNKRNANLKDALMKTYAAV